MLSARGVSLLTVLVLGLVTAAGAALRLEDVTHSLWLDELHTAWCVAGDFADIAPRARIGNYSPLYFWLVWISTHSVGLTEWGVRLPSLLAGIALVPVIHLATARFTRSRAAGLTAAAIVALDGAFFGWYSQEARPFALVQLLSVIHVWVFFELASFERKPAARRALRALLVAATVTLFYLHYTTVLLLCGELAWYAACRFLPRRADSRRPVHYSWRALAIDLALAAAACLPAVSHLAEIFARRANWAQFVPQPTWRQLGSLFEMAPWALAASVLSWAAARVVAALARIRAFRVAPTSGDSGCAGNSGHTPDRTWPALLAYCWYFMPLSAAALLTYLGLARVCYPRYLMACSVALPVVAAWGVAVARRKHLGLGIFVSLLTILVLATRPSGSNSDADMPAGSIAPSFVGFSFTRPLFIGHFTEDWRGAVAFVREHDREGRHAIFLWAGLIEAAQLDAEDGPWPEPPSSHEPEKAAEIAASPTNGAADQEALRQYLLFPISGPYALDDGRTRLPLTPRRDQWLTPGNLRQARASGGGWFIFRSPEAIYPDHPRPIERLARDLTEEFAERGLRSRATHRQSFRGLAVIHLSVR